MSANKTPITTPHFTRISLPEGGEGWGVKAEERKFEPGDIIPVTRKDGTTKNVHTSFVWFEWDPDGFDIFLPISKAEHARQAEQEAAERAEEERIKNLTPEERAAEAQARWEASKKAAAKLSQKQAKAISHTQAVALHKRFSRMPRAAAVDILGDIATATWPVPLEWFEGLTTGAAGNLLLSLGGRRFHG